MTLKKHVVKLLAIIVSVFVIGYFLELYVADLLGNNLEILAELFSVFVSFSIFAMTWFAYSRSRDNHALFMGAIFLVVGLLDFFHTLSYPFMPDLITPNSFFKSATFWILARFISAPLFLASAYIYKDTLPKLINKPVLITSAIVLSLIALALGLLYSNYLPTVYYTGGTPSIERVSLVVITAIIILYASYLYTKRKTEGKIELFLTYGFIIVVFSDIVYFSYDISGHLLKIAGFYFVYLALYKSSVELPYEKLALAEEKLLHSVEEKYLTMIEHSNDLIWMLDKQGNFTFFNKRAEDISGYKLEKWMGRSFEPLIVPLDLPRIKEIFLETMDGKSMQYEVNVLKKDGTIMILSANTAPIYEDGEVVGTVSFGRDITEQKRAEDALEKLHRQNELILGSAGEGIFGLDVHGRVTFINIAGAGMLGYEAEELIGKPGHEIWHHSKPDGTPYLREECPVYATCKDGFVHREADEVFWRMDGTSFPVEYVSTPIYEKGKLVGAVVVFNDITEREKAERLRFENERLILANQAKSEFLAVMSHELRTPLNAVIGFSELMKMKKAGELNEKQERYMDNILTSSKHLLVLINDILDLTKVEAGKIELVIEKIAVPEAISETLDIIKTTAEKRNVILKKEIDPLLDYIEADRQRFEQILDNLVSNAVKFSKPEGGIVTVTAKKEKNMAKISVSDTGIGIKEENMGKLFKAFHQLDSGISRKYGGIGLGLAISKQLVELHGGKIWAESKYGEGSTFNFILPIAAKVAK